MGIIMKIHWRNAREEYPKDYESIVCLVYYKNRHHHKWDLVIGDFNPKETFRCPEYTELWQWARVNDGFETWIAYEDVKYWCKYSEFLKYIKKTIR
jgi:hypothetical protein